LLLWDNPAINEVYATNAIRFKIIYSNVKDGLVSEGNNNLEPLFDDSLFNLSDSSYCVGNGINSIESL
jgi:hypothetical protein